MAISADVKNQLFRQSSSSDGEKLIRLPHESDTSASSDAPAAQQNASNGKAWTREEHERFLEGLELFPSGPWKEVAAFVGTRTTRQTMTHAQKYREKIARRKRGLRGSAGAQQRATLLPARVETSAAIAPSQQQQQMAIAAAAATTLSVQQQQQRPQLKQVQASPTSVALKNEMTLEDPLDFDGCFMELDPQQFHFGGAALSLDFALDQTLLVALAASEGDYPHHAQLSLSDEEMDLIMDSVVTSSSPSAVSTSAVGPQNAFSFVC